MSVSCAGAAAAYHPFCDPSCSTDANSSDDDPGSDCLTKYRGPVVQSTNSAKAMAMLQ
jgi:hypothetical protein